MSDFTFGRKKAGTSNFSSPSLVSPHTPTLANPVRGFGLPTNNVIQTQTAESAEQQAVQAADERSKLLLALEQPSFGHHISRYALRRPQAELMMAEPGDKYEMEAPESTDKQAAQPAAERSKLSLALEQPSFGHHISRYALRRPQAKLTVGEPGDKYEQEADWMANQVMRMVVPDKLNADGVQPVEDTLQRKCTACEQEFDKVQTKPSIQTATDGGFEAGDNIESQLNSSKGGGSPLAPEVRSFMEPRFGADFSGVRVHTGSDAVQMNQELGAQAFTHGSDVYFGAGKSAGNNELTAHELTHVVQQTGGVQTKSNTQAEILQRDCDPTVASCPPDQTTTPATPDQTTTPLTINEPGDRYEQEANRVAEQVMRMPNPAASSVQRMAGDDKQDGIQTKSLATSITPLLQREAMPEEEEKKKEEETKQVHHLPDVQQKCLECEKENALQRLKKDGSAQIIQRQMAVGHNLTSPRFAGDPDLDACYNDEARLTIDGMGEPGTRKIQSGSGVKKIKEALIELGYLEGETAVENYTQKTWDAVKKLKKDKGLGWENMGDVGPGTMQWLNDQFPSASTTCPPCPSPEPRPSSCQPCLPNLPSPPQPINPPGPIKPPGSVTGFCVPFLDMQTALTAHALFVPTMVAFTAKFGSDVQNLWIKYLTNPKSGTKGTLPPRKLFGDQKSRIVNEFREDPETKKQKDRIMKLLADRVRSNPNLMPQPGQSTPLLDFRPTLGDSELLDLPMSFQDPANKIPGLIAGGFGKNSSDAGDDVRNVDGKFIATSLDSSVLQIRASFVFDVFDCVDFCPGNSGSGLALGVTIPMSMFEATPDIPTYDVPFEVVYGLSDDLVDDR